MTPFTYRVEHISAGYDTHKVINDISFKVNNSSLCAIVGVNGSGKSTLLKALSCQINHTGTSFINELCVESMTIKERALNMSYLPQKSGVAVSLPVIDVVLMGYNAVLKFFEKPSIKQKDAAIEVLKSIGLEDLIDEDYLCLSEGQKQLVLLARLMIENTKVLLLDEMDGPLDFHNRYEMMKILKSYLISTNALALMCIHDLSLALRFADQLILLKDGQVNDIIYPKKDSVEKIQSSLAKIYPNIKIYELNKQNEIIYLTYWEKNK